MKRYLKLKDIRESLAVGGFRFKRRWGQNFLIERNLLDYIVREGEVSPQDLVLEIGSGPGCLTRLLLDAGARVIAVEIDPVLYDVSQKLLFKKGTPDNKEKFTGVQGDFLSGKEKINPKVLHVIWEALDIHPKSKIKVISNLPYCIATATVMNIVESQIPWELMVVTLQEEVADRFMAQPGSRDYGQVSALLSLKTRLQRIQKIKPGSFWPKPEVDSMVIKIKPLETPWVECEERYKKIKEFTRAIFAHRRKTWLKSLKMCYKSIDLNDFLVKMDHEGFHTGKRAQELNIKDITKLEILFNAFLQEKKKPGKDFSSN